jgi:hypothetical protein
MAPTATTPSMSGATSAGRAVGLPLRKSLPAEIDTNTPRDTA